MENKNVSETKFTPGPWHINTLEVVPYTVHANRGHVATCSFGTMNEVNSDEVEANARLIANAPELLRALERLLRANESDVEYLPNMDVKIAFETNSMAIQQAREAIATAKGTK